MLALGHRQQRMSDVAGGRLAFGERV